MRLLDMLGGLMGRKAPKSGNPLMDALLPMLLTGGAIGGLGGLLGRFTSAGLGGKAHSWVGTGDNEPLDPDDVEKALGRDEVERIARRDFNFVFPGEEAYAVLPAPPAPVSLPASWPYNLLYAEVLD